MKTSLFSKIEIEDTSVLDAFARAAHEALRESVRQFRYPEILRRKSGESDWRDHVSEIKKLNIKVLESVRNRAGVYAILEAKKDQDWQLRYIGQTSERGGVARIQSHLVWRNKHTKSGKFTGSKFDDVQHAVIRKREIWFSFVEIHPASLRQFIESYLIQKKQPQWNFHGTTLSGQLKSARHCML